MHGQVGHPCTRIDDDIELTMTFIRSRSSPYSYPGIFDIIVIQCTTYVVETPSLSDTEISAEILLSCFFYEVFQENTGVVLERKRRPFPSICVPVHHSLSHPSPQAYDCGFEKMKLALCLTTRL